MARLVALAMLGALVFSPPLLAIFAAPEPVGGVVVLFAYVYFAWAVVIALAAWIMSRREGP